MIWPKSSFPCLQPRKGWVEVMSNYDNKNPGIHLQVEPEQVKIIITIIHSYNHKFTIKEWVEIILSPYMTHIQQRETHSSLTIQVYSKHNPIKPLGRELGFEKLNWGFLKLDFVRVRKSLTQQGRITRGGAVDSGVAAERRRPRWWTVAGPFLKHPRSKIEGKLKEKKLKLERSGSKNTMDGGLPDLTWRRTMSHGGGHETDASERAVFSLALSGDRRWLPRWWQQRCFLERRRRNFSEV